MLLERAEYLAFLHKHGHRIIKRSDGVDILLRARRTPGELPPFTMAEQALMDVNLNRDLPPEGWSVEGGRQQGPILLVTKDEASFCANPACGPLTFTRSTAQGHGPRARAPPLWSLSLCPSLAFWMRTASARARRIRPLEQ